MSISGFLTLGTAVSGGVVVPPPSNAGYTPQPINFDLYIGNGVRQNSLSCNFGPATASWGTITVFGVEDENGNPVMPTGTLQASVTPVVGQMIIVPQGNISITGL